MRQAGRVSQRPRRGRLAPGQAIAAQRVRAGQPEVADAEQSEQGSRAQNRRNNHEKDGKGNHLPAETAKLDLPVFMCRTKSSGAVPVKRDT